jgi:TolA-binding protein
LQELLDYLKYFPTTQFASSAQYYIADIYFNQPDYEKALEAYDAVLEKYPDGNKTPDAHYNKAVTLLKLGRNDAAAAEFLDVIRLYPGSDLAAKAAARRREMGLPVRNTSSTKRKGR